MKQILSAVTRILQNRFYLAVCIVIAAIVFSLLFWIQVKTVPGNDSRLQIAVFGWKDWAILAIIAILNSIFITIEIYVFNIKRQFLQKISGSVALVVVGAGTSSGIMASIFSIASCSLCVSAIFGFLGANSVVFLINNRGYVVIATFVLLLLSLYLSSKRFGQTCKECQIKL